MSMRRRLNGSFQGKRAMHKARQKAKYKRQAQQRRVNRNNSNNYYYNSSQNIETKPMSNKSKVVMGIVTMIGYIIFLMILSM